TNQDQQRAAARTALIFVQVLSPSSASQLDEWRAACACAQRQSLPSHRLAADRLISSHYAALPEGSVQNPILLFAPSDLVGLSSRLRPFLGQLGTTPSAVMPDSHNAGDFGAFLVGAPHIYSMSPEDLARHKTDGHMDVAAVRAGAIVICPV